MRNYIAITALIGLAALTSCSSDIDYDDAVGRNFFAMDTAITFKGSAEDAETAENVITELDALFDRYSEKSDIYALNCRMQKEVSPYTAGIISEACSLSSQYGQDVSIFGGAITDCWNIGSESPKVPSETEIAAAVESLKKSSFDLDEMSFADEFGNIDLGSVAKGYALDKVREELGDDAFYIVSASSSVLLNGTKPDGEEFTVSVRDPENPDSSLGIISTEACFVSTSGGYERFFEADGKKYSHIFNLETGQPSETDLTSVTVMCDSGIKSDFLSTLIYVRGTECLEEYLSDEEFLVLAVTDDNEIYLSSGVDFEPAKDCSYEIKEFVNE